MAFELAGTPPDVGFLGGDLVVLSGKAKGKILALRAVKGNMVSLGVVDWAPVAKVKAGDAVRVDNSNFLTAQTYPATSCRGRTIRSTTSSARRTGRRCTRSDRCCWGRCSPPVRPGPCQAAGSRAR